MSQLQPSEAPSSPVPAMSPKEAAVYATDLLLELRNITSAHRKLSFLTYLLEMAFQEAFNASSRNEANAASREDGQGSTQ